MRGKLVFLILSAFVLSLGACSKPQEKNSSSIEESSISDNSNSKEDNVDSKNSASSDDNSSSEPEITYMSVSEAVALANEVGEDGTSERQYVTGIVKTITNTN